MIFSSVLFSLPISGCYTSYPTPANGMSSISHPCQYKGILKDYYFWEICEGHSLNKVKEDAFFGCIFFKERMIMCLFMSQKSLSTTSFTNCSALNFFLSGDSVYFHYMNCLFDSGRCEKLMLSQFFLQKHPSLN